MNRRMLCTIVIWMICSVFLFGCTAYMAGNNNLDKENYEAAISNYQEVLSKKPDHWKARDRLGFAYLKTGQLDKAIVEFETVLSQKPGEPYATYYLGLAWLNKGDNIKTISTWETYRNEKNPLVEEEIKRQLMVLEMVVSLRFAKQALAEEEKLERVPPKSGTVSVFYFKDITPDNRFRPLQKALAAMLVTDLSKIEALKVLERMRVQCLLTEMELGQCGIVDEKTAPRAGRLLGAENLIVGTLEPGSMAVKTSVASTIDRDIVGTFSVRAEEEEFFELQKEMVFNIIKIMKVSLTEEEEKLLGQYQTKNFEAVVYFGQGLDALDASEWEKAKNLFIKAYRKDPEFQLAKFFYEGCPGAGTPALATLVSLSQAELAAMAEESVGEVGLPGVDIEASESAYDMPDMSGGTSGTGGGFAPTGSVTVTW